MNATGTLQNACSLLAASTVTVVIDRVFNYISTPEGVAGHTTTEVFASGGVHALVRLLENVLHYATEPQRSVWVREVLALLYPLARRSRMVARLLVRPSHSALKGLTPVSGNSYAYQLEYHI